MNCNKLLFLQIQTLPPSMHHKWQESFIIIRETTNRKSEEHQFRMKSPDKLKDNSTIGMIFRRVIKWKMDEFEKYKHSQWMN